MGKRLLDVTLGSVLGLVSLPVIFVLAIASALSLKAWPFFLHDRVGRDGRIFRCPKLRSLPVTTPEYVTKYDLGAHPTSRFGRWLRRNHLDELPQLLLVPLGRMSLVGPRPEMPVLHAKHPAAFAGARTVARPGCTGLWQIGVDCHRLIHERPEYDLFYLRHAGLRLDLWILCRSLRLMLFDGPMVRLEDVPSWAVHGRLEEDPVVADEPVVDAGPVSVPCEMGVAVAELA